MEEKCFFAMMSRMKYIERWSLMRNSREENISEHCLEVSMIAHALAVISNSRCNNNINEYKAAVIGMFHDSTEIITGDMPTPIKYYNKEIKDAYKQIEHNASIQLMSMLPEDMRSYYDPLFFKQEDDEYIWKLVKAADKLSALIKCIEEQKAGNEEFVSAHKAIKNIVDSYDMMEVKIFVKEFLPSYYKTLDELNIN